MSQLRLNKPIVQTGPGPTPLVSRPGSPIRHFREILCPGNDEADQFNLLTQLCLETGSIIGSDSKIRHAQEAIAQAVREREGTAFKLGVTQQITELERQRDALNYQLINLQQQDPALETEIQSTEERRSVLHAQTPESTKNVIVSTCRLPSRNTV